MRQRALAMMALTFARNQPKIPPMTLLLRCFFLCLSLPVVAAAPLNVPVATPVEPAAPPAPSDGATAAPADGTAAAAAAPAAVKPTLVQLDATRFKLGDVEFDKQTRAIRFPAVFNQREGLLEYVLVHAVVGKTHESLLRTSINATHLNLALRLLRYESSPELFPLRDEGHPTGLFPRVDAKTKAAARVEIRMLWKLDDTEHSAAVNELIVNTKNDKPMPAGPWVYGGSIVHEGRFVAEMTGDIVAILTNEAAIFNYPGASNQQGDNYGDWFALTKSVPPIGTPLTVEIRPWPATTKPAP